MTNPAPPRLACALLALAFVASCSSSDPDPTKATSAGTGNEKRDTAIKHEPCDANAAGVLKTDANGDGKFDIFHVMSGGKEVCRIVDLNLDGAPDAFIYYDAQGLERRRESDFDRDGRADEIAISENGQIKLKLRETNFDNQIDTWDYYENGRLVRRERDSDGDGIIDQWWQFDPNNPKCATVASDRNADGKPDPDSVVDLCGESYGATPKPPASAAPGASGSAAPTAPGATVASPPAPAVPGGSPAPSSPAPGVAAPSPSMPGVAPPPGVAPGVNGPTGGAGIRPPPGAVTPPPGPSASKPDPKK